MKPMMMPLALAAVLALFPLRMEAVAPSGGALPATLRPEPQQRDSYDWKARHAAVLARNRTVKPDVVFFGDSITHFWGGEPSGPAYGPEAWASLFKGLTVTNLGFGFDYADNAYYRILNGELDGISPKVVLVNIGTNNLGHRHDSAEACAANVTALVRLIRERQPKAKILLLGIYPRREPALAEPIREVNRQLKPLADGRYVFYADPGSTLLGSDGLADPKAMRDTVHPNAEGYRRLGKAIRSALEPLL